MALAHSTITYDVSDCKVYPLLSDSVAASPTYGAAVDVPGIQTASLDPNIVSQELKGDASVIDTRAKIESFKVSLAHAKTSLDVMAAIIGGSVVDAGTTPNQTATFSLGAGISLPYFKVSFLISDADTGIGGIVVTLMKCKISGGKWLDQGTDKYGSPSYDCTAVQPLYAATKALSIVEYETAPTLS